jgi:uncharacterized LabA/DUF88 family protein
MSNPTQNVAVFIDGDNISGAHYQKIMDELRRNGRILVQRVYADFSKPTSSQWRDIIVNYGLEAVQVFRVAKKESTDNTLIVDCMRVLYNNKCIHSYVIVSSDSDFSSLAAEIRLRGQFCVGIGYKHTPMKLRNNCDRFILIESLGDLVVVNNTGTPERDVRLIEQLDAFFRDRSKMVCSADELIAYAQKNGIVDKLESCSAASPNPQLPYLKMMDRNRIYWLKLNEHNLVDLILKMMNESDRAEIHMSWLKDMLLCVDSTFDQRLYGFSKMSEFSEMVISGTDHRMGRDKNNESVIILNRG